MMIEDCEYGYDNPIDCFRRKILYAVDSVIEEMVDKIDSESIINYKFEILTQEKRLKECYQRIEILHKDNAKLRNELFTKEREIKLKEKESERKIKSLENRLSFFEEIIKENSNNLPEIN